MSERDRDRAAPEAMEETGPNGTGTDKPDEIDGDIQVKDEPDAYPSRAEETREYARELLEAMLLASEPPPPPEARAPSAATKWGGAAMRAPLSARVGGLIPGVSPRLGSPTPSLLPRAKRPSAAGSRTRSKADSDKDHDKTKEKDKESDQAQLLPRRTKTSDLIKRGAMPIDIAVSAARLQMGQGADEDDEKDAEGGEGGRTGLGGFKGVNDIARDVFLQGESGEVGKESGNDQLRKKEAAHEKGMVVEGLTPGHGPKGTGTDKAPAMEHVVISAGAEGVKGDTAIVTGQCNGETNHEGQRAGANALDKAAASDGSLRAPGMRDGPDASSADDSGNDIPTKQVEQAEQSEQAGADFASMQAQGTADPRSGLPQSDAKNSEKEPPQTESTDANDPGMIEQADLQDARPPRPIQQSTTALHPLPGAGAPGDGAVSSEERPVEPGQKSSDLVTAFPGESAGTEDRAVPVTGDDASALGPGVTLPAPASGPDSLVPPDSGQPGAAQGVQQPEAEAMDLD
jgi:hypothetical protein